MDLDLTGYREGQLERYLQLSAAVLIVYEYLLQLRFEVDYFWKGGFSWAKVLFLWNRYYGLAYNIGNAVVFVKSNVTLDTCTRFFHWQNTGATLQYLSTQLVLILRMYALYQGNKWILAFLVFLICCEIAAFSVLFNVPMPGLVGTNEPLPDLFLCADGDPPNVHWISYVPASILIVETILLLLALYKAIHHWRRGTGVQIVRELTRASVGYFIIIFVIHVLNEIVWLRNRLTLNESITGFSFVIPSIMANRLLISIRRSYEKCNLCRGTCQCHTPHMNTHGGETTSTRRSVGAFTSVRDFNMDDCFMPSQGCIQTSTFQSDHTNAGHYHLEMLGEGCSDRGSTMTIQTHRTESLRHGRC